MLLADFKYWEKCYPMAVYLLSKGYPMMNGMTVDNLTELLIKLEMEKDEKNAKTDSEIDYNDEIVEIIDVGDNETIDISVSGDNLFYCNGILTKNSFGVPATADFMIALTTSEELEGLGQLMVKQLKNRFSDPARNRRFVIGIDRPKMRLYDVELAAQDNIMDDTPTMDKTEFGRRSEEEFKRRSKFDRSSFKDFM